MRIRAGLPGAVVLAACVSMCVGVGVANAATPALPQYQAIPVASPNPQATPDSVSVFSSGFGERLRTIGDVNGNGANDVLVSNVHYNLSPTLTAAGRLWIFDGRTRALIRSIDDPQPQANARFGFWSAALGDVDGDGVPDFVTSADNQTVGANTGQGEVFIFSGRTGQLVRTIDDPDPQMNADFGGNVIAPGDLNGDGITDLVVTASKAAGGAGIAYAFSGSDGHLLYRIPNPDTQLSSFGFGAAELGDVNGDGIPGYQIGAPFYQEGTATRVGRSYVISGKDGSVLHTLTNPDPTDSGARFGQADADGRAVGDINGDGKPDVYVDGFLSTDAANVQAGLGYLFDGASGSFISRLHDPAPQLGGQFGTSDAAAGNLDGRPDLIVGQTPHHSASSVNDISKASIFGGPGLTNLLMTFQDPQAQANSDFGNSIASPGDVNGDGYPDYFIGSRSANTDFGQNVGIVWALMSSPPPPAADSPAGGTVTPGTLVPGVRPPGVGPKIVAPGVTNYRLTNNPFVVSGAKTPTTGSAAAASTTGVVAATRHKRGTTFRYTLSEAATVKIIIVRRRSGRRTHKRCVAPGRSLRHAPRCIRLTVQGMLTRISHRGANGVAFSGRIGSRALAPGTYRATLTASDGTGHASRPKNIVFTIAKR